MEKYFNNNSFLESIPGNSNAIGGAKSNTIYYVLAAIALGAIGGYFIQQHINKKYVAIILKENVELKNRV
jgi:outer membrane lipoprotein SlyB